MDDFEGQPITDSAFRRLVKEMREAQRKWFKDHDANALEAAKRLERHVDREIKRLFSESTLF